MRHWLLPDPISSVLSGMRSLVFCFGLLASLSAAAQGGIRLIIWNYEQVVQAGTDAGLDSHFGIGYDHDLEKRLSYSIQFRYGLNSESFVLTYHSAFHFNDNYRGSFYLGPIIGVRRIGVLDDAVVVPVGMRIGVRGGLERFYADLHAGGQYNIGGSKEVAGDPYYANDLLRGTFCFGLDLAWGWDKRARR